MAKKSRATFQKREKERARQQKQHDKAQRRVAAKEQRASSAPLGRDRAGCMAQAASYPVAYTGCVWREVLHEPSRTRTTE